VTPCVISATAASAVSSGTPATAASDGLPAMRSSPTSFNHVGLNSTNPERDEKFWTQVCNARASDRIGDIPLMRVNAIHHTIALVRAQNPGLQHINHQVASNDDVMRSYYLLQEKGVPIVFGPAGIRLRARASCISRGPTASCSSIPWALTRSRTKPRTGRVSSGSSRRVSVCGARSRRDSRCRTPRRIDVMDFGLRGRRALVCAASQGLGRACALALAHEGSLSNGACAGLTGFVAGLSRSVAEHNVTVNNLLPGTFDTDRLKSNIQALAKSSGRESVAVSEEIRKANPTRRFGDPEEFGAACAFLCSRQASYIMGQNILIDRGAFPGLL
jgi:catechol 2,3-dioxygenase-like lactoylglutathione lyase family enzyme